MVDLIAKWGPMVSHIEDPAHQAHQAHQAQQIEWLDVLHVKEDGIYPKDMSDLIPEAAKLAEADYHDMMCMECGMPATHVLSTQFAGKHPYCQDHLPDDDDVRPIIVAHFCYLDAKREIDKKNKEAREHRARVQTWKDDQRTLEQLKIPSDFEGGDILEPQHGEVFTEFERFLKERDGEIISSVDTAQDAKNLMMLFSEYTATEESKGFQAEHVQIWQELGLIHIAMTMDHRSFTPVIGIKAIREFKKASRCAKT